MLVSMTAIYLILSALGFISFAAVWIHLGKVLELEELRRSHLVMRDREIETAFKLSMTEHLEREFRKVYHAAGYNPDGQPADDRLEAIRVAAEAAFKSYDDASRKSA